VTYLIIAFLADSMASLVTDFSSDLLASLLSIFLVCFIFSYSSKYNVAAVLWTLIEICTHSLEDDYFDISIPSLNYDIDQLKSLQNVLNEIRDSNSYVNIERSGPKEVYEWLNPKSSIIIYNAEAPFKSLLGFKNSIAFHERHLKHDHEAIAEYSQISCNSSQLQ
jgi:hypothetical protein